MKVLAYLAFTLLSILIQFSVMDLIQEKMRLEERKDLNLTSPKKKLSDILKDFSNKPHALFYRNNKLSDLKVRSAALSNTTETEPELSLTTTVYDILMYDENATTSESTISSEVFSTTEVDQVENITELSIFGTKNATTPKPATIPKKKAMHEKCDCDFLQKVCDINCCCDDDCTKEEIKLFVCPKQVKHLEKFFCSEHDEDPVQSSISGLFCIAGSNLPDKRISNFDQYKDDDVSAVLARSLKWQDQRKLSETKVFTPKKYSYGDPIWLLKNETISFIDLPSPKINSYCHGRTPIQFLKEDSWQCDVTIQDLEMLHVLKNIEDNVVVSVTDKFINDTFLNCSSLHCTTWTIIVCNEDFCTNYNKSLHEPTCNDSIVCTNLAHKLHYVFNYHDEKITNATIYLYTQSYSPRIPIITQQVSVAFYISQNSTDQKLVKLSGNPGYLKGLPVIVSVDKANFTERFFNKSENILLLPENKKGACVLSNTTYKIVNFGTIAKNKCRYNHKKMSQNATAACEDIHNNVSRLFSIDNSAFVSPLGNPYGLGDKDWLRLEVTASPVQLYGEYRKDSSELFCSNVVTKVSFMFGYADVSETPGEQKIKILVAKAVTTSQNVTFNAEEISIVLTFETIFFDVTKKPVYEYARSPNLNIHLPKDFFFPFHSNSYKFSGLNLLFLVVLSYVIS